MQRLCAVFLAVVCLATTAIQASDHLDTPSVIADPASDIADLFAWTSPDGKRLNLVMTIVAKQFSDQLQYVFHVDSGSGLGRTTATTAILCRFDTNGGIECWAGDADHARGDASKPVGLEGARKRFRVFAGLRNDPFFNNVKGTRAALNKTDAALRAGTKRDAAGCPAFSEATSHAIYEEWRHTSGGPAKDFLADWQLSALVVSIDLDVVTAGGKVLGVWATVHKSPLGPSIERIGRPLTGNALISPLAADAISDARKEEYNRAPQSDWPPFAADIQQTLALYDGFDGQCGNQWLADKPGPARYRRLAQLLADDRLWVNTSSATCTQFMAVERNVSDDCGGRTPLFDAVDLYRSLLSSGKTADLSDGVDRDDHAHSASEFPFLAEP
jgi:hypothetical protein